MREKRVYLLHIEETGRPRKNQIVEGSQQEAELAASAIAAGCGRRMRVSVNLPAEGKFDLAVYETEGRRK